MLRRRSAGLPVRNENTSPSVLSTKKSSSTSRLKEIFKPHGAATLDEALNDFETASKLTSKLADVQKRGASRFSQWARGGENVAIDDVACRMRELMNIYSDQQSILAEQMMKNTQSLRLMLELEQEVKEAEKKLADAKQKEKRLEKDLHRLQNPGLFSKSRSGDATAIRQALKVLMQSIQEREKAEQHFNDVKSEAEIAKMYQFRKGMKGLAESYCNYSEKTSHIFKCHRELTELVPAIATEDINYIRYEGMPISRQKVDQVRRSMESSDLPLNQSQLLGRHEFRRRSEPQRMGSGWDRNHREHIQGTPPPPYSPAHTSFTSSRRI